MGISSWVGMLFQWFLCIQNQQFISTLWYMLGGIVWLWIRATYFSSTRIKLILAACQNKFDPHWTNVKCASYKPPHCYLQQCTEVLLNMTGVVSKTTNSQTKVMLSREDNSSIKYQLRLNSTQKEGSTAIFSPSNHKVKTLLWHPLSDDRNAYWNKLFW